MYVQTIGSWENVVHLIGHGTPEGLTLSNVASIQVLPDLIPTRAKLHGSAIMAFVDVLVNVFDGLDGCNPLEIDMAMIFPDEIRAVRHNPAVVNLFSIDLKCSPSITTTKNGIGILRKGSLISEWLWKVLGAFFGVWIHARGIRVVNTTGIVNHEFLDQLKKL